MPRRPMLSVALDLAGQPCLVVGGGRIAARRMQRLLDASAEVTVVAPAAVDAIREAPVRWEDRPYRSGDLDGVRIVVTATGVEAVDAQVVADANAAGIPVNDASDGARSTLLVPGTATAGPITVSVHTGGASPALTAWLRDRIAADLADGYAELTELMSEVRTELLATGHAGEHPGWRHALDSGLLDLVRDGDHEAARRLLRTSLDLGDGPGPDSVRPD